MSKRLFGIIPSIQVTSYSQPNSELKKSELMLQRVIDLLPTRIFWKDVNSIYLSCNMAFAKDAGKESPSELIGKSDFKMGWKKQAKLYRADDQKVIQSGESILNFEEPQNTPDGSIIWLRTSKVPLKDISENIIGILGIYDDITERKKADDALITKTKELEAFNKIAVGRELKMVELKNKLKDLEEKVKAG